MPATEETCRHHIATAVARGLPEALSRQAITIIANGPTALDVDLRAIKGPTLAVNGAIRLFTDQGLAPTYWAACDPQALVADFLPDEPPMETIYLVASKCHPSVIEKLKGRDVRIWHVTAHPSEGLARVMGCTSITMCATWLLHRMGFTDFDYHGWDGCFIGGRHHASDDSQWDIEALEMDYDGEIVGDTTVGGRTFETARSWAAEAMDATLFFQLAERFDLGINIHGDGMFRYAREFTLRRTA